MRIGEALGSWLHDLKQGDPVAIGLLLVFLAMLALVVAIWIVHLLNRKRRPRKRKKPRYGPVIPRD